MSSQRSSTRTRLRSLPDILGVTSEDLIDSTSRSQLRNQIGWLEEKSEYSLLQCPILHENWTGKYDINTAFLNPKIISVR